MSNQGDEVTVADKAFEAGKKAASAVGSGIKKATNYAADTISAAKGSTLVKVMRYLDIILGVALIAVYPIGLATGNTKIGLTMMFMFVYCVCFSLLFIFFEIGLGKFEGFIKKYFGFMYTYMGRTVFLLFTVSMVFGRGSGQEDLYVLNTIVGVIGIIICLFDFFVVCNHPAFKKGGEYYNDGVPDGVEEEAAPAKKPTQKSAPKKNAAPAYESNPFESSSDDDIPQARVPGKKSTPKKSSPKRQDENPFEDDNPFD